MAASFELGAANGVKLACSHFMYSLCFPCCCVIPLTSEQDRVNDRTMAESGFAGRVLALDVGSKRIGVAISDELGITAQGLETIQRQNKRRDLEALRQLLAKYQVKEVVIGLPLRLSGTEGTQAEKMRTFAQLLSADLGVTVHLWDERWTSAEANRLLREAELSIQKRAKAVDRMAAVLILQSWLEAHPRGSRQ